MADRIQLNTDNGAVSHRSPRQYTMRMTAVPGARGTAVGMAGTGVGTAPWRGVQVTEHVCGLSPMADRGTRPHRRAADVGRPAGIGRGMDGGSLVIGRSPGLVVTPLVAQVSTLGVMDRRLLT
jgi:hypothetical protein